MHPFEDLFFNIQKELTTNTNKIEQFPSIAYRHLERFNWDFNQESVLQLLNQLGPLPIQSFPNREFGEIPFTLFRDDFFFLDLYIWNKFETSIHDHHFCGAFKLLAGRSHQHVYEFTESEVIDPLISKGKLTKIRSENLKIGSIQKIEAGDKFIHQVCHLGHPTVTLCVRTTNLLDNLFCYHTSGYRFKYNFNPHKVSKFLDYLDCLKACKNYSREELINESHNIFNSFNLIEIMACVNRYKVSCSEENRIMLLSYIRDKSILPGIEVQLEALELEEKMNKKLYFLKQILG
jgi:hypothetical protein